jgi:hypothetical protein
LYYFSGETNNSNSNGSNLFPIIITLFSTLLLTLTICAIIGTIIVRRRQNLRKIGIMSISGNVCSNELYEETNNENDYEIIDNILNDNFYHQINYDQLNGETIDENLNPNPIYGGNGNEISTIGLSEI